MIYYLLLFTIYMKTCGRHPSRSNHTNLVMFNKDDDDDDDDALSKLPGEAADLISLSV